MCELVRSTFFKIRILLRTETGQFLISQDVRSESRPAAAEARRAFGGSTLIRSFRFIFIVCNAPQQAHAAVAIVRAYSYFPNYRQNHNRRKSKQSQQKSNCAISCDEMARNPGFPIFPTLRPKVYELQSWGRSLFFSHGSNIVGS